MSENPKKARFINLDEVINRTSLTKSTIYDLMKKKQFPQSINITQIRVAWLESDIDRWIESKINQQES
ncbi:MAG: AlpA family phage regulatory protein [[Pasteurella] mairii]|uniref:Predicted transcriptional regulator n=1 Tax=[Pasteurella] mairii TaxID=757 RepID=A0A379B2R4_9PAST|nr:AlpA family phage regulatory protein [[Pasteurella] mairii]SUB32816.1 Predicted transcriptional regulator [[Pasteurella] mairii]